MELLLLGWSLGIAFGMARHHFVVKPELVRLTAELRRIAAELKQ
jgi:hypothetical protein